MAKLFNRARVNTATAGTGTMTLGSAVSAAYFTFAEAGVPDGTVVSYVIEDGNDVEMGIGTYTVSGTTLSRDTVTSSKISGTAGTTKLTLSGSAVVFIDALAADIGREPLIANRTYYVRTDGNDSNTGLVDSAGGAFLTLQRAYDVIAGTLDLSGFDVTVNVGDGTYTAGVTVTGQWTGGGTISFVGDEATPANVLINGDPFFTVTGAVLPGSFSISGFKTTSSVFGAYNNGTGVMSIANIDFGATTFSHITVDNGGFIYVVGPCTISDDAGWNHILLQLGATLLLLDEITVTGTPNFPVSFVQVEGNSSLINIGGSYTGAATGQRFIVIENGTVYEFGASLAVDFFPGDVAGTVASGGVYADIQSDYTHNLEIAEETAATNTVTQLLRLTSTSSGSPAAGIGAGIEFQVETAAANNEVGAIAEAYVKDATSTSEDFGWRVKTMTAGQAAATSLDISLPGTAYPQGHIFGLTLSNDAGDAPNDIGIAAGEAVDETGVWNMVLSAAVVKRIDAAWVVGTAQGGMANNGTGVADNNWYEVLLIGREDTRVVDVAFSLTANRATLPTSYTHKRRIGWVRRGPTASTNSPFTQVDDHFTLTNKANDASITATATAAQITVLVPPNAIGRFRISSDSNTDNAVNQVTIFSEIVEADVTPSDTTGLASIGCHDIAGAQAGHIELRVSATSQIEHDSSHTANVIDVSTFGWIDNRRRMSAT
jgi:hypothetical protein